MPVTFEHPISKLVLREHAFAAVQVDRIKPFSESTTMIKAKQ
jgi:hypothetical protein